MTDIFLLNEDDLAAVNELKMLREERKDIEARESELRSIILQRLDGAPQGITGSGAVVVKVKTQTRRNVDRAKLEALFPDVFEEVVSETTVDIVTLP